jgi:hypothetical protein
MKKSLDAFTLTETHLEIDFQKILPKKQLLIHHHGPEKQSHQGANGGVGVIILPKIAKHWKNKKTTNWRSIGWRNHIIYEY